MNPVAPTPQEILVTGGSGFIGSHLVRHLLAEGHRVGNLDKLTYAAVPGSLADVENHENYVFFQADVADEPAVHEAICFFKPTRVVHLAAESHVDRSILQPDDFIRTNVGGTATLLRVAQAYWAGLPEAVRKRFRLLHVSTDEVFGSLGSHGRFDEASPYRPRSPYAASKAAADHLVRAWGTTYGFPAIISFSSNNYGPRQHPEKLIPTVITRAFTGAAIPVYGPGTQVRDWLHVEDHCRALSTLLEHGQIGESYAIGAENEWRNLDLVREICRRLDRLRPRSDGRSYAEQIERVADRPGHDFRYALDTSKMRRVFRWQPSQTATEGWGATIQWYVENRDWWQPVLDGQR